VVDAQAGEPEESGEHGTGHNTTVLAVLVGVEGLSKQDQDKITEDFNKLRLPKEFTFPMEAIAGVAGRSSDSGQLVTVPEAISRLLKQKAPVPPVVLSAALPLSGKRGKRGGQPPRQWAPSSQSRSPMPPPLPAPLVQPSNPHLQTIQPRPPQPVQPVQLAQPAQQPAQPAQPVQPVQPALPPVPRPLNVFVQKLQHSNTIVCGLSPSTSILFRAPHELLADWNLVCAANAQVCPMLLAIALVPPVTRSDVLNLFSFWC